MSAYLSRWTLIMAIGAGAALALVLLLTDPPKPAGATSDGGEVGAEATLATSTGENERRAPSPLSPVAGIQEGRNDGDPDSGAVVAVGVGSADNSPDDLPRALSAEGDHCAADVNADGYADIFDVTAMVHYFGQSAPLEYDIHPPLQSDGYVDIFDIIEVTQHFGQACFGFTATETAAEMAAMGEPMFLQECSFKAEGWWASTSGSWANIWPYMGASNCNASPGLYSTRCAFEFLADQNGWVTYITTPIKTYAGTWCESSGIASANLPMWTPLHEQVCFEVSRDGHVVKPWRCIPKPSPFFIPCQPGGPPPSGC